MNRLLVAVCVVLALPVLALPGLAVVAASASGDRGAPAATGLVGSPGPAGSAGSAPAEAYRGASSGCTVRDPTGTGGCITPATAHLLAQVTAAFGPLPVACWSARGGDPRSDHPQGKACDYTIGRIGTYPARDDVTRGWQLATWLRANNQALQVNYVIWQGRIWSRAHDTEGWRPYTGGGYYPSAGPTYGHYDHVHVSVT